MREPGIYAANGNNVTHESAWPLIKSIDFGQVTENLVVHKFAAYVYNKDALEYLATEYAHATFVLLVRDPKRSLISWYKMHRQIALSGSIKSHFAYIERDFYANCSIDEYYKKFAKTRLEYDKWFKKLISILPNKNLIVVSQSALSKSLEGIGRHITALALDKKDREIEIPTTITQHIAVSDIAPLDISKETIDHLDSVYEELQHEIKRSNTASFL